MNYSDSTPVWLAVLSLIITTLIVIWVWIVRFGKIAWRKSNKTLREKYGLSQILSKLILSGITALLFLLLLATIDITSIVENSKMFSLQKAFKEKQFFLMQSLKSILSSNDSLSKDSINSSAKQLVIDYYAAINQGNYQEAWNKLPSDFRNNSKLHPKGYLSFKEHYNKTAPINIKFIEITENNGLRAVVTVYYTYNYNNVKGRKQDVGLNFKLFFDKKQNQWRIEGIIQAPKRTSH
jgi:hypothetical protein